MTAHFDAAWLAQHQTRMATLRGEPVKPAPLLIEFSIPQPLKLPNRSLNRHWSAGYNYRKTLLSMVSTATQAWSGHLPMERARVTVVRYSVQLPDQDNLMAALKPLIDILLVKSKTHPHSLGFIRDDSPQHITLVGRGEKISRRLDARTSVKIENLT